MHEPQRPQEVLTLIACGDEVTRNCPTSSASTRCRHSMLERSLHALAPPTLLERKSPRHRVASQLREEIRCGSSAQEQRLAILAVLTVERGKNCTSP